MINVVKANAARLSRESQFQVDFLLECIERYEQQQAMLQSNSKPSAEPAINTITPRSVLTREELAMLTTLF